jgi:hypothetical protein
MIDEPNFEVTNLRAGLPNGRTVAGSASAGRRRKLTAAAVALALLGMLALLFARAPGIGEALSQALRLPTPIPTAAPPLGANVVYVQHGLPWGTLRLDSNPVAYVDTEQGYTGKELRYTSLHIPPGRHQLTYRAEPFPTLRCWISAPAAQRDTCPVAIGPFRDVQPPFAAERVLNLGGDPVHLPVSQQAALQEAAARYIATLTPSATIVRGATYADDTGAPQVASEPMTATLSYVLNPDPNQFYDMLGVSPRGCAILCAYQPASYLGDPTASWVIAAHVVPAWTYTRADGDVVTGSATPQGVIPASYAPLAVSWDGAWHVGAADVQQGTPTCLIAFTTAAALGLSGASLASLTMVSAPSPAAGCLMTGNAPAASGASPTPFTLLYRFGLLYAVDNEARSLLPGIPRATASLQGLARAWAS